MIIWGEKNASCGIKNASTPLPNHTLLPYQVRLLLRQKALAFFSITNAFPSSQEEDLMSHNADSLRFSSNCSFPFTGPAQLLMQSRCLHGCQSKQDEDQVAKILFWKWLLSQEGKCRWGHMSNLLIPCYSNCSPCIRTISICPGARQKCKFPGLTPGLLNRNLHFNKIARWFCAQ